MNLSAILSLAALPLLAAPGAAAPALPGSAPAIFYPWANGAVFVGFRATRAGQAARGRATVRAEAGRMRIHAHFSNLGPASRFGPTYLTYVLWAVSPMGRAVNLGEVAPRWNRAHVEAETDLQDFALIVSAEPHFGVTRVSHAVVLENLPRPRLEAAETRYQRLEPAAYALEPAPEPRPGDPPHLPQARLALRIARAACAPELAPAEFGAAQARLEALEEVRHGDPRVTSVLARRAIQHAEEARQAADRHRAALELAEQKELARDALAQAAAARSAADLAADQARQKERAAAETARAAGEARQALRRRLQAQLDRLLRTRESGEGLVATLADVGFASGRSEVAPAARVNLAKVAGILLAHPGLKVRVLGHTDGTGRPEFNHRLSWRRAEAVRAFLAQQGLPQTHLEAAGVASAHPVASDATPEGRRQNRRVDLVIQGEAIGL